MRPHGCPSGREFSRLGLHNAGLRQDPSEEEEAGGTSIREQSFHPVPCALKSLGDPRGPGSGALSLVLFLGERQ